MIRSWAFSDPQLPRQRALHQCLPCVLQQGNTRNRCPANQDTQTLTNSLLNASYEIVHNVAPTAWHNTHEHTAKPHLSCMSDASGEGSTPSPQQPYPQHNQPTAAAAAAAQQQGSATMMSGSFSVPIRAPASEEEERIQIAGSAGTVHVHDVLCGRGKVSFNHGAYSS